MLCNYYYECAPWIGWGLFNAVYQACTTQKARRAKLININSPRAASLFCHSVEEILKGQVIIRSRAFATFSATEFSRAARKDLAGRMWPAGRMLCRPVIGKYGQMRFRRNLFQRLSETRLIIFTEQFRLQVNVDARVLYILHSNK